MITIPVHDRPTKLLDMLKVKLRQLEGRPIVTVIAGDILSEWTRSMWEEAVVWGGKRGDGVWDLANADDGTYVGDPERTSRIWRVI
jgi:hypothetical protein